VRKKKARGKGENDTKQHKGKKHIETYFTFSTFPFLVSLLGQAQGIAPTKLPHKGRGNLFIVAPYGRGNSLGLSFY